MTPKETLDILEREEKELPHEQHVVIIYRGTLKDLLADSRQLAAVLAKTELWKRRADEASKQARIGCFSEANSAAAEAWELAASEIVALIEGGG